MDGWIDYCYNEKNHPFFPLPFSSSSSHLKMHRWMDGWLSYWKEASSLLFQVSLDLHSFIIFFLFFLPCFFFFLLFFLWTLMGFLGFVLDWFFDDSSFFWTLAIESILWWFKFFLNSCNRLDSLTDSSFFWTLAIDLILWWFKFFLNSSCNRIDSLMVQVFSNLLQQ